MKVLRRERNKRRTRKSRKGRILIKLNCTHKQTHELEECFIAFSMLLERELKLNEQHGSIDEIKTNL